MAPPRPRGVLMSSSRSKKAAKLLGVWGSIRDYIGVYIGVIQGYLGVILGLYRDSIGVI